MWRFNMKKKYYNLASLCLALLILIVLYQQGKDAVRLMMEPKDSVMIAIDAGHGGFDPGKVGVNKALEKDINLSIALKLKDVLEQNNIKVLMTREDEKGLYKPTDSDKKHVDMRNRVSIINSSNAKFAISIHQNSFTQESSKGAQVFYYSNSEQGKIIAETIQERIKLTLNDGNKRLAKANGTYYMLKNTNCPLVIVECGFLSNWKEAELLCTEEYRDKVVWAIYLGIMDYLNINKLSFNFTGLKG